MMKRTHLTVMTALLSVLVTSASAEAVLLNKTKSYQLDYDTGTGRLCLRSADGPVVLSDLGTAVDVRQGTWNASFRTPQPKAPGLRSEPFTDALGKGQVVYLPVWSDPNATFKVASSIKLYEEEPFFVAGAKLEVTGKEAIELVRLAPLDAAGGLSLDADPRKVWFIENGNGLVFDFYIRRLRGNMPAESNGDLLFYAPGTNHGLVIGFLRPNVAMTAVKTEVEADDPPRIKRLIAQGTYTPPKPLQPGQTIEGEGGVYVELTRGQPLEAAERWARCVARMEGYTAYARGNLVKWNPWAAKYNHGISEQNMSEEMDAAAVKLLPYGMNYFHLDSDWERAWGDWDANGKFPHGMKSIVDRMHKLGFKASTWIAPFAADKGSAVVKEHPDWFLTKSPLGQRIVEKNRGALDLSRPEVKDWLRQLFHKLADDFGYDCFKLDFVYYTLACGNFSDKTRTHVEAYREAVQAVREAIGPNRMLVFVGVPTIIHAGLVDVIRLGLDNKPAWDKAIGPQSQGIRTSVRTLARRYYLNGNLWVNHPDCLFTGDPETARRWNATPITLDEARAWNTLVGLSGGVLCLGDSIAGLDGSRLDMIRRITPQCGQTARPLDLFEHGFPELWNLELRRDFENWNVIGVFHWGENDRWGEPMPDAPRTYHIKFADLGLEANQQHCVYEFWSDRYLGVKRDGFDAQLQPHSCQVFAVRQARDVPQILSINRHISQGGVEVQSVKWDDQHKTLSCTQKAVGGWPYSVALRVPKGFQPAESGGDRASSTGGSDDPPYTLTKESEELWRLKFTSPRTQDRVAWTVPFSR